MNQQQTLNLVMGMSAFLLLFITIVMDFFDRKYGKFWSRMIYIIGMVYVIGQIIRTCDGNESGQLYFLTMVALLLFVRKLYQLRDKVEIFERQIEHKTRLFHKSLHP